MKTLCTTLCALAVGMFLMQPAAAAPPKHHHQQHGQWTKGHGHGHSGHHGHHGHRGYWGHHVYPYRYYSGYTYSVPVTTVPLPQFSVQIVNPAQNGVAMPFNLGGQTYWLAPGTQQDLLVTSGSVIQFSRGPALGVATYSLQPGIFSFSATSGGWDLFQQPVLPSTNLAAPSAPLMPGSSAPAPSTATPGTGALR